MTTKKRSTDSSGRTAIQDSLRQEVETWYAADSRLLEGFRVELHRQIESIVEQEQIPLAVPVQSRVKLVASIIGNIERDPTLANSYFILDDLCGFRLILLFKRDIVRTTDALEKHFGDLIIKKKELKEDQLGYTSTHCIVPVPESWLTLPTASPFRGLKAEIQVRTVSQHTWAAASHELQYKEVSLAPPEVRRALYRLSAVLEIVDDELERVRTERDNYRLEVEAREIDPDKALDSETFNKLLEELLPKKNYYPTHDDDNGEILLDLREHGYNTATDVRALWERFSARILIEDAKRAKLAAAGGEPHAPMDRLETYRSGAFYSFGGLLRSAIQYDKGEESIVFPRRNPPEFDTSGNRIK